MVRKHYKKSSRHNVKSRKGSKKGSRKGKTMKRSMKVMRGGDHNGLINLPQSYFGKGTSGYYASGSPELKGSESQVAVSAGSVWSNCKMAGPNLYPMLGGGCGCSGGIKRRSKKTKNNKKH